MPIVKNLASVGQYSIDLVNEDTYTYSIQITDSKKIIADLPLDAPDNTLAATMDAETLSALGQDATEILEALAKGLEKIGGKEFVVMPVNQLLPGYVPVQDHNFKRTRQADYQNLVDTTSTILDKHPDLVHELDNKLQFVVGISNLANKIQQPYHKIFDLLEGHANFTEGKMQEYKQEDIEGIKARFHNKHVTSVSVLDENNNLVGIMRCLAMGSKFGYLSDETFNQNVLQLSKFSGDNKEEQMKRRGIFLLAYFANKVLSSIQNLNQFLIIAAAGREGIYESIGFENFPIKSNEYVATMKFAGPGLELSEVKTKLMNPFSNAEAVSRLGLNPAPQPLPAPVSQEEKSIENRVVLK